MNLVEMKTRVYNSAIKVDLEKDLTHFRTPGSENGIRRYQYLDGSLTPEGRIHYGVGMSRKERKEAEEAEAKRQRAIDEARSKSIREMTDDELQEAILRARNEGMFEKNQMDRANNFLQSRNIEERLNMEYDDLQYEKSRQKAERFMKRMERLMQFGGNVANLYGKIQDVKGKVEDFRSKRNQADQQEWISKQNEEKYYQELERTRKQKSDNAFNEAKRLLENNDKSKEKSDGSKEVKKATGPLKSGNDSDFKPTYEKKVGDEYVYSDKTKSKWQSIKDKIAARKENKEKEAEAIAAGKRQKLKEETYNAIAEANRIERDNKKTNTVPTYWEKKAKEDANLGWLNTDRVKNKSNSSSTSDRSSIIDKIKSSTGSSDSKNIRPDGTWVNAAGGIMNKTREKHRKRVKHSEEE